MKQFFLFSFLIFAGITCSAYAQPYIMWEDNFSDDDPQAARNVGWLYLGEAQNVKDASIAQVNGELLVRQGTYELLPGLGIGVCILETNGVKQILWDNLDSTATLIKRDNYNLPNQVISFKIRFDRWRNREASSSFFSVNTRLNLTQNDSIAIPNADATREPAYALAIYPLSGNIIMGKYDSTQYSALFPTAAWTKFGETIYKIDLNKNYRIKFYLYNADIKAKIWTDGTEEPAEWLLSAVDPTPRVTGNFVAMGMLGTQPAPGEGDQFYLDDVKVEGWAIPTSVNDRAVRIDNFTLEQNYPNPFNPQTRIAFSLQKSENTRLTIYNLQGQVVRTLIDTQLSAGRHEVNWNGDDKSGHPVASGIYVYRLYTGETSVSKRMLFLK